MKDRRPISPRERIKQWLKILLKAIPIPFTQNQRYDYQTRKVIRRICQTNSHCIDIGAHKGEVLDMILHHAPLGNHLAFEPIPGLFQGLKRKYAQQRNVTIYPYALDQTEGTVDFNYVISNPAYSGLKRRRYDREGEKDTSIKVETRKLDSLLSEDYQPSLIKIDVEGGELGVLEGAEQTLKRTKPTVIFEHGLGAADYYGSGPDQVFRFFNSCDMKVSTMARWLAGKPAMSSADFKSHYEQGKDYYFIAYP